MADPVTTPALAGQKAAPTPYYAMVVDSGPIIKQDVRNLMGKAEVYITTPSVLREIRDSRARDHLEHSVMPLLDLKVREPSDGAMQDVIAFAKQTGDYPSLSTVDLQVLALTLDLEREGSAVHGNTNLDHIRTTPKRKIGLGTILPLNQRSKKGLPEASDEKGAVQEEKKGDDSCGEGAGPTPDGETVPKLLGRDDYDEVEDSDGDEDGDEHEDEDEHEDVGNEEGDHEPENPAGEDVPAEEEESMGTPEPAQEPTPPARKTWATLVNPSASSAGAATAQVTAATDSLAGLSLASSAIGESDGGGQFDDASEDEQDIDPSAAGVGAAATKATTVEEELDLEFPSLSAAATVPFEGEDDEIAARGNEAENGGSETGEEEGTKEADQRPHKNKASVFMTEEEKQQNLKPLSKSGRTYNSFRKYKGLMKPKQPKKKVEPVEEEPPAPEASSSLPSGEDEAQKQQQQQQSTRFLGGGGGGETMLEEDDDGVGWITSAADIQVMKTEGGGRLDPGKTGGSGEPSKAPTNKDKGPTNDLRTACATTDFAMQNVLLQMNLILLSTEGMRIRRLKSWVIRCGACFHIHGADEDFKDETNHHMRRLFCSHCGSGDMMQRISASVDGKTGRLKLHFSRRKQGRHHSIRGTKFSLPKPGGGNKYKGDLLLREDQLLSGAWNQKVKINSGKKYQQSRSQSMFGRDIASSVGCNVRSTSSATFGGKGWSNSTNTFSSNGGYGTNSDDIRVGFGARKNPNAAKGRERRGKKKKSSDRACGMRRY